MYNETIISLFPFRLYQIHETAKIVTEGWLKDKKILNLKIAIICAFVQMLEIII